MFWRSLHLVKIKKDTCFSTMVDDAWTFQIDSLDVKENLDDAILPIPCTSRKGQLI